MVVGQAGLSMLPTIKRPSAWVFMLFRKRNVKMNLMEINSCYVLLATGSTFCITIQLTSGCV